ncbi:MAG: hypothetical protein L6R37_008382 [Teloschistes peruensis]|nr:MAG: hypothetical protein L6R37_008382 [Teloschistes peruensis]
MSKEPRNPNRAIREKFRKRKSSLLKKADELTYMCQTDVYLVLYRGNTFYTYSSTDRDDWPPSEEEIDLTRFELLEGPVGKEVTESARSRAMRRATTLSSAIPFLHIASMLQRGAGQSKGPVLSYRKEDACAAETSISYAVP